MKNQDDDGTLPLFHEAPHTEAPSQKASPAQKQDDTVDESQDLSGFHAPRAQGGPVWRFSELLPTQVRPRRNSPRAKRSVPSAPATQQATMLSPQPAAPQETIAHVMLVITKGEAGGAQSHVLALCRALQTRVTFTVVIGGPVAASVLGRELTALGISVCPIPDMVESLNPLKLWPAVQQLTQLIGTHRPDIVHAHSAIAGVVARVAAHRARVPVVYTVHGFGFKREVALRRRCIAAAAEWWLAHWTDQMICVSAHERTLAYDLPLLPERVHTIANGLPRWTGLQASTKTQSDAEATTTHSSAMPRLIMVARMKQPKRHDLLLHALADVRQSLGLELSVTLAGDGPLHAQHLALAEALNLKGITWAGDVADVPALLAQHDLFVLLSDHEGMPITVLEAMRAGLCVLASDLPGIREQITSQQEGVLTANTTADVAAHLLRLVREPHLRHRLGRAAQQRFESDFSADQMANEVMQVYRQCQAPGTTTTTTTTTTNTSTSNDRAHTHSAGLVSASVRRRDALQRWALWGVWLLVPSLIAAQRLEDAGLMTYQFGETLWWCVLPYAVATHLLMRASHLPVAERSGVLWVSTTAPFVFTPLGFALLQQPYSRAAVLWAYAATTGWLWWGYRRHVKHRALRLVYIDANVPAQLAACLSPKALDPQAVELMAWNAHNDTPLPACDGVVLDRHVPITDTRTRLLGELKMQHLRLYSVEAVAELTSGRKMLPTAADTLWEIDNDPSYDRAKRLLDVLTVIVLTPVWVPLAACVALAVRFDSKGPALYSQARVGRDGQLFTLWKFRSMVHGLQAPGVHFAQAEDPRITRVGRVLRRTRLDELPQLFNVLMGHMSLIGPRPEQTAFVRDFATTIPCYPYRHLVRPGLTGWAQVQQGYADSADATRIKLSYDLYYVAHYSLALDLLIAAKTVKTVCTGFGAR